MKLKNKKKIIEDLEFSRQGFSSAILYANNKNDEIAHATFSAHHKILNRVIVDLGGESVEPLRFFKIDPKDLVEGAELHPAITHINASPEFLSDPKNIAALNRMAEAVYNTTKPKGDGGKVISLVDADLETCEACGNHFPSDEMMLAHSEDTALFCQSCHKDGLIEMYKGFTKLYPEYFNQYQQDIQDGLTLEEILDKKPEIRSEMDLLRAEISSLRKKLKVAEEAAWISDNKNDETNG